MKLTPLDVKKQEFRKTLRGFDPIEVQTFLEMVADEYEQVLENNKNLNRKVVELETKLQDYQESEKNLRETLLNVQEVKKQSEESSKRQADLITKEAELKALEIVEMARKQARQMRDEVSTLRSQKESFINRLRQILISQIELLSVLEIDDALPEEAHQFLEKARSRKKGTAIQEKNQHSELGEAKYGNNLEEGADIELAEEDEGDENEESNEEGQQKKVSVASEFTESDNTKNEQEKGESEESDKNEKKTKNKLKEDDDLNEFFKKGIQIDELIKNLDKKQQK